MKYFVDLHIHSALSPCAADDMTPNNIVNMSMLKGLDFIAVTDHNSAKNCRAVSLCAAGKDILAVPGMEVETREEVHVLCLFPGLKQAAEMQQAVDEALPFRENREEYFGRQLLFDEQDRVVGKENKLLLSATELSLTEVVSLTRALGGVAIPAHINRSANSIISQLGFVPKNPEFKYLEITSRQKLKEYEKLPDLQGYSFIVSSDAHSLGQILERTEYLYLEEYSIPCLLATLCGSQSSF
jgi:PHP family Zn ribbon phosphoesterase